MRRAARAGIPLGAVLLLGLAAALPNSSRAAAQGSSPGPAAGTLRVRSFIDGRSWFVVQGGRLWIRHLEWVAPGRWANRRIPTYVNGEPWQPEWPFGEGEGLHCRCDSSALALRGFDVPQRPMGVLLRTLEGRGRVTVLEHPHLGNGFRVVVETDDIDPSPAWYEFEIALVPP
ncbi:MAG: hypothetical protein HYY21_09990 [Candidatus Tectomicrobia bacterium]|nr:hypothetical protein [Candidatus Tectomicrobia bacterium]